MNLRIPGPTPVPERVRSASGRQMIDHRGAEFAGVFRRLSDQLSEFFGCVGEVLILTGSGTGGLEAAVVNTMSPGDRVLAVTCGVFGDRFADIACAFGGQVDRLVVEPGKSYDVTAIDAALRRGEAYRLLLTTYNETSTGVLNDLGSLAEVLGSLGAARPLWLVDAVSCLGAVALPMATWGCDVVISASQKAWMAPPGLALIALSDRAWEAASEATCPKFYWDLIKARSYAERGQTPYTPAVSLLFAMSESVTMMLAEGEEAIVMRHRRLARRLRDGLRRMDLAVLAKEHCASPTVTALCVPQGWDARAIRERMADEHGVVIAGGQGILKGRVLRIAHMGYCGEEDIDAVVEGLGAVLGR